MNLRIPFVPFSSNLDPNPKQCIACKCERYTGEFGDFGDSSRFRKSLHKCERSIKYFESSDVIVVKKYSLLKAYWKFTSFCYSDVLIGVKKDEMVAECLDVQQIEQTKILI